MSEVEQKTNQLSKAGATAIGIGIFVMLLEVISGSDSGLGAACCCFGIFGAVAGSIVSSAGAAVSSNGEMVLKQNSTGQWEWMPNSNIPEPVTNDPAANYNDQNTQIMSRLVTEIRGGRTLQDLDDNELSIVASTYGVNSGSKQQKIEALHNSVLAKSGLKLGAIGVAAGVGAVGASRIIKSGRERAIERAEELREQGREKLRENIEAGKYNINSKLPTTESGESATDVANNIVLDQLKVQIEKRGLTPEILLQIADSNKDGRLDANEIATAMSQATGFAVPAFIVGDAMKDFDVDKDGAMDINELHRLWSKLGFSEDKVPDNIRANELTEPSDEAIEELDNLMEEEGISDDEIEAVFEEIEPAENDVAVQEEARLLAEQEAARLEEEAANRTAEAEASPEVHAGSGELTDGIDTEFERLVLEMEGARFSSERKTLMEKQTSEFLVNLRIEKMERTLIGDPVYRSGQSVHALIDGGPYVGVIKIPVSFDEKILAHKAGDEIQVWAKLVDFSPSLKRPVLEASEMV